MSSVGPSKVGQVKPKFPWGVLLLLLAAIYLFWILPIQLGPRQVKVQYETPNTR